MLTFLFLAGRIVASPMGNIFQKQLTNKNINPLWIVFLTYLFLSVLTLPIAILYFHVPLDVLSHIWPLALAMGIVDAFGNLFLVKSVQKMDISLFGPLNSFKPAIAMLLGIFIVQEFPNLMGVLGIVVIIIGSFFLNPMPQHFRLDAAVVYRFLSMFCASLGAVFSKKIILASSPLVALFFWMWMGVPVLYIICRMFKLFDWQGIIPNIKNYLGVIISIACMQFFTLLVFARMQVSYGLALFQLSSVLSVLLGAVVFKEKHFFRRLSGALVMMAGALIIIFFK